MKKASQENCYHRHYYWQWNKEDNRTKMKCLRCDSELLEEGIVKYEVVNRNPTRRRVVSFSDIYDHSRDTKDHR